MEIIFNSCITSVRFVRELRLWNIDSVQLEKVVDEKMRYVARFG